MTQISYPSTKNISQTGSRSGLGLDSQSGSQSESHAEPHSDPSSGLSSSSTLNTGATLGSASGSTLDTKQRSVAHHEIPQEEPPQNQSAEGLPFSIAAPQNTLGRWETFARHHSEHLSCTPPRGQQSFEEPGPRQGLRRRQPCNSATTIEEHDKAGYLPLSRTTDRVLRILLDDDLSRVRAEGVAETLGISCTTLRRRLRNDHTSYQFLLDRARQYRCESRLRERWLPGKCLADELGYLEVNSFYRAFRRWTGLSYSDYRQMYH